MAIDLFNIKRSGRNTPFDDFSLASAGRYSGVGLPSSIDTNIEERTANLLVEQFITKPRINELVRIFARQVQELEYVLADMLRIKNVNMATGDQLDILGEYVGEERNGRNDNDYRQAIILRSFLNKSNGEPETIIQYAQAITNATDIKYIPIYPGKVLLQIITNFIVDAATIEQIQKIAPAGVKILVSIVQEGFVFGFGAEGGFPPAANVRGFSEIGFTSEAGKFIEVI
jgi:hypothetical protein